MHRRGLAEVVLVLVLVASPFAGAVAGPPTGSGAGPVAGADARAPIGDAGTGPAAGVDGLATATPSGELPNQSIVIEIQPDGDARWTVSTYVTVEDENETAAFEEQAAAWVAGTTDVGYTAETFRGFAAEASEVTGRPMRIPADSVERSAELLPERNRGVFRLSFTWTNFARREGDRLVVDDVFQSTSGTWLPGLQAGQILVIRPPPDYTFRNAPQGANLENGSLIWRGPTEFSASYFMDEPVVFASDGATPTRTSPPPTPTATPTPTPTRTQSPTSPPPGPDGQRGLLLGILGALLLGGGLALYRRYGPGRLRDGLPGRRGADRSTSAGSTTAGDGGAAGVGGATTSVTSESATAGGSTDGDPFEGVDEDLLADDERVHRLLEANGGRMKQADIVKETGWSNAKVSQLLSSMEDEGEVDKLRIGRENLISHPDVDVGEFE